ncbi:hypothetical protein C8N46_106116 [Kordia periserrulae]|uniref:Uncharacterized protein n=1 Tax=Kordia periserrulae TaxID=701523 RepID=A0A2T6BWM0_9FLAO|nr:hypothetical protein [Kordia periserrulae]PTX60472.1 hypothetical protein C8N46_106116 [Kordia periserrulae]
MKNIKECTKIRQFKGIYSCDNYADVYIGDCNQVRQKIASNSSLDSVQFEAKATCEAFIYFVCWSDDGGLNGLLAELHGSNSALSGTNAKWEVFPTGINFSSHTTRPSEKLINTELKKAHCKKWKKVTKGNTNGKRPFRTYQDISKNAHFIWYDSGKDSSAGAPFQGFNHDEFLIFRFPIRELFVEECHDCKQDYECDDNCHCGACADSIKNERKLLKKSALEKTFVIKGDENNSRRCKAPYSEETCSTLDLPRLEPCFYLHWGDSQKDQMETHDDEVLYITACNPYGNLSFRGVTITSISILYKKGFVKKGDDTIRAAATIGQHIPNEHPDGSVKPNTPILTTHQVVTDGSIQIVPNRLIHLGDLCGCSCASQALYLSIQNAKPTDYEILIEYCIDQIEINQDNTGKTRFPISLIKS